MQPPELLRALEAMEVMPAQTRFESADGARQLG